MIPCPPEELKDELKTFPPIVFVVDFVRGVGSSLAKLLQAPLIEFDQIEIRSDVLSPFAAGLLQKM